MNILQRRINLSMLFLAFALLLLTACGTMKVGAEHLQVQEDEPPAALADDEPTTPSGDQVPPMGVHTPDPEPSDDISVFEALLTRAIERRDFALMQSLMGNSFGLAGWRSEGWSYAPDEAIEQLRVSYLGADKVFRFPDAPDLSQQLDGRNILSVWNPAANPVSALFSVGWGTDSQAEAFLIVAQRPDGTLYWDGMVIAPGGFLDNGVTQPPPEPGVTISPLSGPSGTLVQVVAKNFPAHAPVTVGVGPQNSEFGEAARGTTDADGAFTVQVAAKGAPGMNLVFAVGIAGQPGVSSPDLFRVTEASGSGATVLETDVRYVMALLDVVPMYSGPGEAYDQIGGIFGGMAGTVTGVSLDRQWWRVMCPDDTVGSCWVSADPSVTEPTTPPGS